jgi:hypothetical protein
VLGDRWYIPKEHSKNHRAHWVALSRQALALTLRGSKPLTKSITPVARHLRAADELAGQAVDRGDLQVAGVDGEAQRGLEDRQGRVFADPTKFGSPGVYPGYTLERQGSGQLQTRLDTIRRAIIKLYSQVPM